MFDSNRGHFHPQHVDLKNFFNLCISLDYFWPDISIHLSQEKSFSNLYAVYCCLKVQFLYFSQTLIRTLRGALLFYTHYNWVMAELICRQSRVLRVSLNSHRFGFVHISCTLNFSLRSLWWMRLCISLRTQSKHSLCMFDTLQDTCNFTFMNLTSLLY